MQLYLQPSRIQDLELMFYTVSMLLKEDCQRHIIGQYVSCHCIFLGVRECLLKLFICLLRFDITDKQFWGLLRSLNCWPHVFVQVALKTLIVIHRAIREVDPTFQEVLLNHETDSLFSLSHFNDDSSPIGTLKCHLLLIKLYYRDNIHL